MPGPLTRRTVIAGATAAGLALTLPPAASSAEPTAYAAFRIVRTRPGTPSVPEITLPPGYSILAGTRYSVASRAEYYTFVVGPRSTGIEIAVRWPDVAVETVVHQDARLALRPDPADGDRFTFTLPVTQTSADANQPTLQVWSFPENVPGMNWRIEHNDADRVAGPWTSVPWPAGEVRSVVHQLVAANYICHASGLVATAAAKGHRWVLMGFETNNTLHADNPPHWHISYNSGRDFNAKTHNPHLWLDREGKNFYNGMDVTGMGRFRYYVGDPAPMYDFIGTANGGRGNLTCTMTLREDGGIDIAAPEGPTFAIAAGRDGTLLEEVTVLRDNAPWLRIATVDRVLHGVTAFEVTGLADPRESVSTVIRYDRLTGVIKR